MINKVLLEKLFKMNGLSVKGIVVNEDEKKANVLSSFGLSPTRSHEYGGEPIRVDVSPNPVSNDTTSLTEDNINKFKLI